jgi:hypothetical protein
MKQAWHPDIQRVITRLANTFQSFYFQGHITIKTNMKDVNEAYNYYKSIPTPYFTIGPLEQTVTVGSNGTTFYALQRALYLNGSNLQVSTYHVSFAYRHRKFSEEEFCLCEDETSFIQRIEADTLDLQVWSCNSNPKTWKRIVMY